MNGQVSGRKLPDMIKGPARMSIQINTSGTLGTEGEITQEKIDTKGILGISIRETGMSIQVQDQDHDQGQDRDHDMSGVQKPASITIAFLVYPTIVKVTEAEDEEVKDKSTELDQTAEQARMMKGIGHIGDEADRRMHEVGESSDRR